MRFEQYPFGKGERMNRHEDDVLRAVRYDLLTGLPNLAYFFKLAEIAKGTYLAEGKVVVLLYMDLSGMKNYNYTNGFAEGDKLLLAFTEILVRTFGREQSCHIGADRFAAFTTVDGLEEKLTGFLQEAAVMNGGKTLPVQIGIYTTAMGKVPVTQAYDRAKIACDSLKNAGRSGFDYYSYEMGEDLRRKKYILENIDKAIQEKWITVYYQPIVRAVTEKVCDEECLARWIDPAEGFLSPGEFIPYLEAAGLIWKLDLFVLEEALDKIHRLETDGFYVVPHSINLSRSDFETCDIVDEIRERVDAAGVPRDRITIEVTESVIGNAFDFMKEQIERFRSLGFQVWLDDFGSGYSSIDVLQSIQFDLVKFDMSFMRKLDQGENAKIILTELMKMTTALGMDTVCEGVETEEQVRFLQEIGCSKLQGFYYCKPVSYEGIVERYKKGMQIGFEDPRASAYYESIGRVNLYDLGMIAGGEEQSPGGSSFQKAFDTVPMGIIEIREDAARFVRSNPSYRTFFSRFFGLNMSGTEKQYSKFNTDFMHHIVNTCVEQGSKAFYDEKMPDGSVVHSFARRIGTNPVNGCVAVAVAVLSVSDPVEDNTTYAEIARALASDYYNMYVVDLDTEDYIEYSSAVGRDELAVERRGTGFFASARQDTMTRIYPDDREMFLAWFTKENIIRELDAQGVFTSTYRLIDTGKPVYANMKITRLQGGNRIILGVSIIDSEMRMRREIEDMKRERDALARVMAMSEDYLSLYSVNPKTGRFVEYTASEEFARAGIEKEGEDFFAASIANTPKVIHPDDLEGFLRVFTRENLMREIREHGVFRMNYRMILQGIEKMYTLKIVPFQDGEETKLLVSVRAWRDRKA